MGGLRSLWWRRAGEHHNAQQTRMWAEYNSRGYGEQQTTVRPRRRPRAEPQDPVVFGVLMAFAIGVACVLTLEPTTCPYGARQLLAARAPWQTANRTTPPRWADTRYERPGGLRNPRTTSPKANELTDALY